MNTNEKLYEEFKQYFTMDEIIEMVNFAYKRTLIDGVGMDDAVKFAANTAIPYIEQLATVQALLTTTQAELTASQAQLVDLQTQLAAAQAALAALQK